jgi:hypothetical protein
MFLLKYPDTLKINNSQASSFELLSTQLGDVESAFSIFQKTQ